MRQSFEKAERDKLLPTSPTATFNLLKRLFLVCFAISLALVSLFDGLSFLYDILGVLSTFRVHCDQASPFPESDNQL